MSHHYNIVRIKSVNKALKELQSNVVFVGGATISLYADRPVLDVRPTDDIDVIVEILNYGQRQQLEERLRDIGFVNDVDSGIICRFKIKGIIVDIMPTNDPSVGFSNRWYPRGYECAIVHKFNDGEMARILTAPYFIATKMEAFKSRGGGDGRLSHDFEDIIFVLENRIKIWEELEKSDKDVREYLRDEFSALLKNRYMREWVGSHVDRASVPPQTDLIIESIRKFCS